MNLWRQKAGELVDLAHSALLENPAQLSYLAERGIPEGAVIKYRLGYLEKDRFRDRAAWGLPFEKSTKTQKAKKLWMPQGVIIPTIEAGQVHRVRIRREVMAEGDTLRYYWLPGSGNDIAIIEPQAKAFAVVESELDGLACAWAGEGKVGAVPLGSVAVKPKAAHTTLAASVCIFVALDFDVAGIKAFKWWAETYRQAVRWPVPKGKDPGEYVQDHGGDLFEWLQAGIKRHCPVLDLPEVVKSKVPPVVDLFGFEVVEVGRPLYFRHTSGSGIVFYYAGTAAGVDLARAENPEAAVFTTAELLQLKELDKIAAEDVLKARSVFPEGEIKINIPLKQGEKMNELALFAGSGGGILAGQLLGWRTVCAVERDAYPAAVLAQRQNDGLLEAFPIWSDVTTFNGKPWRGIVDVISGGFPCQDISVAGQGAGIDGERSGLWSEFARVIREVRPEIVFVENSPMLTSRGLGRVLGDLAEMGYDAEWGSARRVRCWRITPKRSGLDCCSDSQPRQPTTQKRQTRRARQTETSRQFQV